jgi:hypothetical protein
MNKDSILGLIRHLLTFGGGALVTKGFADDAEMQQLVGALITVIGVIWSIVQKRNATGNAGLGTRNGGRLPLFALIATLSLVLLAACQTTAPTGQIGVGVGPDGSVSNVSGGLNWDATTNINVQVGGALDPATGEWSGNLLITFKQLPSQEIMASAAKAGAVLRETKGPTAQFVLKYDSGNRDHRLFIRAAQERGALISGLK